MTVYSQHESVSGYMADSEDNGSVGSVSGESSSDCQTDATSQCSEDTSYAGSQENLDRPFCPCPCHLGYHGLAGLPEEEDPFGRGPYGLARLFREEADAFGEESYGLARLFGGIEKDPFGRGSYGMARLFKEDPLYSGSFDLAKLFGEEDPYDQEPEAAFRLELKTRACVPGARD